jgi:hypothetical protein
MRERLQGDHRQHPPRTFPIRDAPRRTLDRIPWLRDVEDHGAEHAAVDLDIDGVGPGMDPPDRHVREGVLSGERDRLAPDQPAAGQLEDLRALDASRTDVVDPRKPSGRSMSGSACPSVPASA